VTPWHVSAGTDLATDARLTAVGQLSGEERKVLPFYAFLFPFPLNKPNRIKNYLFFGLSASLAK
jgi:hypothetical protein